MKTKLQKEGWIREENNYPISFDNEGYLIDQITKDILTTTPIIYGTTKQIFNNKNQSMHWKPNPRSTNIR